MVVGNEERRLILVLRDALYIIPEIGDQSLLSVKRADIPVITTRMGIVIRLTEVDVHHLGMVFFNIFFCLKKSYQVKPFSKDLWRKTLLFVQQLKFLTGQSNFFGVAVDEQPAAFYIEDIVVGLRSRKYRHFSFIRRLVVDKLQDIGIFFRHRCTDIYIGISKSDKGLRKTGNGNMIAIGDFYLVTKVPVAIELP